MDPVIPLLGLLAHQKLMNYVRLYLQQHATDRKNKELSTFAHYCQIQAPETIVNGVESNLQQWLKSRPF